MVEEKSLKSSSTVQVSNQPYNVGRSNNVRTVDVTRPPTTTKGSSDYS